MPERLRCKVGEEFDLKFEGNPTTGYVWEVAIQSEGGTASLLDTHRDGLRTDLAGAPSTEVFRFRCTSPGKVTLKFQCRRPWEKEPRQDRIYELVIEG